MKGQFEKPGETRKPLLLWLAASAAVMILIFFFSSQPGEESNALSVSTAQVVLTLMNLDDATDQIDRMEFYDFLARKTAHFSIYFALGICLSGVFYQQNRVPRLPFTVLAGGLYAVSDEFHQSFVPDRVCHPLDMLLDTSGVFCGAVVFFLVWKSLRRRGR